MKKFFTALAALSFLVAASPDTASAGNNWVAYKVGVVKEAIKRGETALLFYKSSW